MEKKTCTKCKKEKEINAFQKKGNGYSSQCKQCRNEYNRTVWYKKNKEKQKTASANWRNKNRIRVKAVSYNFDQKFLEEQYKSWNGKCQLCQIKIEGKEHIDHCHNTGNFRGFLCRSCNTLLGRLGDNKKSVKEWFIKINNYL